MEKESISLETALESSEIVSRLQDLKYEFPERGISWQMATAIPVDFSKFQLYVPIGTYEVELLLKIWNKKKPILHCFFVEKDSANIFSLCAFKDSKTGFYAPSKVKSIDLSYEDLGNRFLIEVGITKTNRTKWNSAKKL